MARIRTIKPEFWTSPDVVNVSIPARLFFIGTWNFADDWGLLLDDPQRLKLQLFPGDPSVDTGALTDELVATGLLSRVTSPAGDRLLSIPTWCSHQKIDSRTVGRWGNPAEWSDPTASHPVPPDPAESLSRNGSGMEGNQSSARGPAPSPVDNPDDDELLARVNVVADAVVASRLSREQGIKNPQAWKRRVKKNLTTEDGGAWWANLERVCAKWPTAPIDLLAGAAEGDVSRSLTNYQQVVA